MRRTRITIVAAVLAGAAMLVDCASGIAAPTRSSAAPSASLLQALAGSGLTQAELATARGGQDVSIMNLKNTTTTTLNVDAASGGTVNGGSVSSGSVTGMATGAIVDSQGIISQFSNTGSNVMLNSSVAIFINAQ